MKQANHIILKEILSRGKLILGIETSCDETAASVGIGWDDRVFILSNIVASSAQLQAKYGGIIPEQAAREQLKTIIPVLEEAISEASEKLEMSCSQFIKQLQAVAVTQGPGLIGSLLVGVETAKSLSLVWNKPIVPVNHLLAHFLANWISDDQTQLPKFPVIGLLVSGGHTDLVLMRNFTQYEYLGGTRDDAAGEAFDKSARLLDLPYPGGPNLAKLAGKGNPQIYTLPKPLINSADFDFSFSGLKTAVANLIDQLTQEKRQLTQSEKANLAASIQDSVVTVLVKKTLKAAKRHNIEQIIVAGGVASNQALRDRFYQEAHGEAFFPRSNLSTDNAAMIIAGAYFNFLPEDPLKFQADPNLELS